MKNWIFGLCKTASKPGMKRWHVSIYLEVPAEKTKDDLLDLFGVSEADGVIEDSTSIEEVE